MLLGVTRSSEKAPATARTFEFSYSFTIKDLTSTARRVRIWIALATSDQNQKLVIKKISSPVGPRGSREPQYGAGMLYAELRRPKASDGRFSVTYEATRKDYSAG